MNSGFAVAVRKLLVVIAGAAVVTACPGTLDNPDSFSDGGVCRASIDIPAEVFATNCTDAICHDSSEPQGLLDLESPGVEGRLLGVPATECTTRLRIDPNDPERSFLLEKLEETLPECGDPMPLDGELGEDTIACIREWVFALAANAAEAGTDSAPSDATTSDAGD